LLLVFCCCCCCYYQLQVGEEGMSLEALAEAIQVDPSDIMRTLFMKGIMLSMNQVRRLVSSESSKDILFALQMLISYYINVQIQ
jgi:hypothetical protein